MISRKQVTAYAQRELAAAEAATTTDDGGLTPYQKLLRAAENGPFEALVRKARPAKPLVMVTPQEREAGLRASGRWPAEKPASTSPVIRGRPGGGEPPARPAAEPTRELTPNEQYLA